MADVIARRTCDGEKPDGRPVQFTFTIEAPQQIAEYEWGCVLSMEGLGFKAHRVIGETSWQALTLAICAVEQQLTYHVQDGGKLFWPGSKQPMNINDLVPRFPKTGI